MRVTARTLDRAFYARDGRQVAPELLGKVLATPIGSGRIVEVEAYAGTDDPGSHGYRGPTPRTRVMYGPPGHLYVYFTYGMHWCANAVCGPDGECSAVLVRALEPLEGVDAMTANRPAARRVRELCNGPAKLCQALGIDGAANGSDLVDAHAVVRILYDGTPPPADPVVTTRVGLSAGADLPWRWYVADSEFVSRP